ncbi:MULTISPECIES: NAD(P)-dependent oxidoreductase [Actinomadura]|uniref:NAD(P)-dependent oxidoreductase n=1 Tax=Actinomadura yumaensis TaxID=111807 RepID=A0ABW2CNB2_9ACTN|nr:NAD(P)-dependent oxidoreductase [Actinomadura sp. J1-007]MWK36688.1 NAD-binding protein [Actinomadura sp. J1-007]
MSATQDTNATRDTSAARGRELGFVGLGVMGAGMAARLLEAGHRVRVYNRTAEKAAPLLAAGARAAATAAEAAEGADAVVVSLADEAAVEAVVFGDAVRGLAAGTPVIDTSTVTPAFARDAARRLADLGVRRVEACVLGNPLQARSGELRVMTAGDPADAEAVRDVLEALGQEVRHFGPAGAAATMKLVLNVLIGAEIAALAEAVALGESGGLDRDAVLECVGASGVSSMVMSFRAAIMRQRRYEPAAFRSSLMAKDLRYALGLAEAAATGLPLAERVLEIVARAVERGDGDKDLAVLAEHAGGVPAA